MAAPVTIEDLRARAHKRWTTDGRYWMAGLRLPAEIDMPLHPPTEREVLADYGATLQWVKSWESLQDPDVEILWEARRWSRVGEQRLPTRAKISGPDAITRFAGVSREWKRWYQRSEALIAALPDGPELRGAIASTGRTIGGMPREDFERLRGTAEWLLHNPTSGRFVRELPIRGIDSKWLEKHRGLVQTLLGRKDLGLRTMPETVRVRFLDPELAPSGLADLSAPLEELDALPLEDVQVLIVENLQTFLALPPMRGVVAVDGHGDKVQVLSNIGWIRRSRCVYWGDLDSHGFRILSRARQSGLMLESCLMDEETLTTFQDLWVPEPKPFRGELPALTPCENATLSKIREHGAVRLEQERIDWEYALEALRGAVRQPTDPP